MTRKALVIGIDHYTKFGKLFGCVNDAKAVASVLESNGDGSINLHVKTMTSTKPGEDIVKDALKKEIDDFYKGSAEVSILYFSGHGHLSKTGGYLGTSECDKGDNGVPLTDVLTLADRSETRNTFIVLDCCNAGFAGTPSVNRLLKNPALASAVEL